jgi:hypothetical protein
MDRFSSTEVLDLAQQDLFDVADSDPKYSFTKLIQINTLTTNVNQDGHIWINLTSDEYGSGECNQLKFRPETSEFIDEQNYYYYGSLVEEDSCGCICLDGNIMLIADEGRKYGYFTVDGRQYEMRAIDTTYSQLCILDNDYFEGRTDCPDFTSSGDSASHIELEEPAYIQEADTRSQTVCVIRVLFLYSPKALTRQGSHASMVDLVSKGVGQMNQALRDSDVNNVRVKSAGIQLWQMTEDPDNISEDMADLIFNNTIKDLRLQNLADLVCLITDGQYVLNNGEEKVHGVSGHLIDPFSGAFVSNLGDPKYALGYMIVEARYPSGEPRVA